jgi:hypothetical protein
LRFQPDRWIIATVVLVLASLACQAITPGESQDQRGRILFQDDFSDPSSGWNRVTATKGETDYADGVYRIYVEEPNMDIWAKPDLYFNDVRIEVDAIKVGGDRDNRFGIICRAMDPNSVYTFVISSDGYYGVGKIKGEQYTLIGMDALQRSDAIQQGSTFNHIRVDCIGDRLTLFVNGQQLIQVQDAEFVEGDVGLIAGTYDVPGTDIRFDNFVVYQP